VNAQIDLSDCTLSTENQAVVDAVNEFLMWLPDDVDPRPALRLAMMILEAADVASQDELAGAAGFSQPRSLRGYKQRLRDEGLPGLWDHPITGRSAITTRKPVEKALFQVILSAVIEEHALPEDVILSNRVNQVLSKEQGPEADRVTASMVETIRLRWEIRRPVLSQQLQAAQETEMSETDSARLGRTHAGGAFIVRLSSRRSLGCAADGNRLVEAGPLVAHSGWLRRDCNAVASDCYLFRHLRDTACLPSG